MITLTINEECIIKHLINFLHGGKLTQGKFYSSGISIAGQAEPIPVNNKSHTLSSLELKLDAKESSELLAKTAPKPVPELCLRLLMKHETHSTLTVSCSVLCLQEDLWQLIASLLDGTVASTFVMQR